MSDASPPERVVASTDQIVRAAQLVLDGEIVAYPTETSYGLAADATNAAALARLARVKGRGAGQHLSVLVADDEMLEQVVQLDRLTDAAKRLMAEHWPGPLTLVLPAAEGLPRLLVNEHGGVGVRRSTDPVANALVRAVGRPVSATSANRSGSPPATEAGDAELPGVALVLDDGPRSAPVSTVAQVLDDTVLVLRPGPAVLK